MAPLEKWLSAVRVGVPQGAILGPNSDSAPWGSASTPINIISVINIKSILLCFASGGVPKHQGPACRSPLAIYQAYNLLW